MSNLARRLSKEEVYTPQKETNKKLVKKSKVTKGEKFFYLVFAVLVAFLSVQIIGNQANIYNINKEIQLIQSNITEQEKVTQDLQSQVNELSEYDKVLKAAEKQGLISNADNVKVVNNR